MKRGLYANRPNLTIGFHGCDQSIEMMHKVNREANNRAYDSVRGVFWEGKPLYPNAGFAEKNHIQICVCNPNCIKGYFLPRGIDVKYPNP